MCRSWAATRSDPLIINNDVWSLRECGCVDTKEKGVAASDLTSGFSIIVLQF
jgi:hypothetical protein